MNRCSNVRRQIMAFMTLKTTVFQNEKKTFQFRNFVPFIVCLFTGLVNKRLKMTFFVKGRCQKGLVSQNIMFLKNSL